MFKVNNKDIRMTDTRTTPGVVLVPLLFTLTYFKSCSSVSIVNFEHVIAGWDKTIGFPKYVFSINYSTVKQT